MGKVGSMAVVDAVERADLDGVEVFHTHRLVDHRNQDVVRERAGLAPRRTWYVSSALSRCVAETTRDGVVLTVVRDPIERNVSGFFQTIERYLPDRRPINPASPPSAEHLVELFIERYPHRAVTSWLDREITPHFGIDPYAAEFDAEKGYSLGRRGRWTIGIARHDAFPRAAEAMVAEALGVDGVQLLRRNTTGDKFVAPLVKEFKRQLVLPSQIVDDLYSSRYATRFGFRPG